MNSNASALEEIQNDVKFFPGSQYGDKIEEEDSMDKLCKKEGPGKENWESMLATIVQYGKNVGLSSVLKIV